MTNFNISARQRQKMAFNMILTLLNLLLQNSGCKIDIWTFYCIMTVPVILGINKVKLVVF